MPAIVGDVKEAIISRATTAIIAAVFIFFAGLLVKSFLNESDYFKLRSVDIRSSFLDPRAATAISNRILNSCRNKNVFSVNLKGMAQSIQASYGDVRNVIVNISLPDKLTVSMKLRRPVGLIKSGRFYPVDQDGVVLPAGSRIDALNDLPIISGVEIRSAVSMKRNLRLALDLLEEIDKTRSISHHGVASVNASDPGNMSFTLKNGVEVRVGDRDFRFRLDLLTKALRDPRLVLENVNYIDVRFRDIIIGPK